MNLFTQGIDPGVKVDDINHIMKVYKKCTGLGIHERHPYAGELVYTAFSGSHQDAIRKGLKAHENESSYWDVPYLPIDPADIGRQYEPIIRINSQSGKGGVAFILEDEYGYKLPKAMHPEISGPVQKVTDDTGKELTPSEIKAIFVSEFLEVKGSLELKSFKSAYSDDLEQEVSIEAELVIEGKARKVVGQGNGPISAFIHAIQKEGYKNYKLVTYDEHAIESGENAEAIAYIKIQNNTGVSTYGAGISRNTSKASIKAIINAINRLEK